MGTSDTQTKTTAWSTAGQPVEGHRGHGQWDRLSEPPCGVTTVRRMARGRPILQATLTTTPSVVHLVANVTALKGTKTSKKALVNWQWSLDCKVWTSVASTTYAKTDIPGLTLMTTYWFRASVTIGATAGEWSPAVCLVVH